jgi:RNA polymerase sigma factor (sigma-70 family)
VTPARHLLHLLRLDDRRLAARVGAGDEAAFATLYERHNAALLSFCRHMCGNREDGEDALQQTFLRAHRALAAGQVPDSVRSWLFAIARNRCLTLIAARRSAAVPVEEIEVSFDGLSDEVRSRADLRELVADLAQLPDDQRAALVLSELADLTHVEIADAIGCQPGKVKALVFQARTTLIADRDARETPCDDIRAELAVASGGALRRGPLKRHLRQCDPCRAFQIAVGRQRTGLASILPVAPSPGLQAAVLGGAGTGAVLSGGAVGGSGAVGGGVAASAVAGASIVVPAGIAGLGVAAAGGAALKGVVAKVAVTAAVAAGGAVGLQAPPSHEDAAPSLRNASATIAATPSPAAVPGGGGEGEVPISGGAGAPPEAMPPEVAAATTAAAGTSAAAAPTARRHRRLRRIRRAALHKRRVETQSRPPRQLVSGEGETPLVPTGTPTPPRRPRARPRSAAPTATATPSPTPRPRRPRPRALPPAPSATASPTPSATPPPRPHPHPRPRKPPPPPPPAPTPEPTSTPESTPEPTATPTPTP